MRAKPLPTPLPQSTTRPGLPSDSTCTIDPLGPDLISLRDVPALLPRKSGKPISFSTVWRWATAGVRGVRLEVVRIGGGLYTSRDALARFSESLSGGRPVVRSRRERQRAVEVAEREAQALGV